MTFSGILVQFWLWTVLSAYDFDSLWVILSVFLLVIVFSLCTTKAVFSLGTSRNQVRVDCFILRLLFWASLLFSQRAFNFVDLLSSTRSEHVVIGSQNFLNWELYLCVFVIYIRNIHEVMIFRFKEHSFKTVNIIMESIVATQPVWHLNTQI